MSGRGYAPFSYVDDENVGHLWHLLAMRKTEPWVIAVVINHLSPELAAELIARLPVELRDEALLRACEARVIEPRDVVAIDFAVRTNLEILTDAARRMVPMAENA